MVAFNPKCPSAPDHQVMYKCTQSSDYNSACYGQLDVCGVEEETWNFSTLSALISLGMVLSMNNVDVYRIHVESEYA